MAEPERKQIIDDAVNGLEGLPNERLEEVRDFVEFLKRKAAAPYRGSPEALLRSFGSWDGAPGELDQLVAEIYEVGDFQSKPKHPQGCAASMGWSLSVRGT